MKKAIALVTLCLGLAGGAYWWWRAAPRPSGRTAGENVPPGSAMVDRRDIRFSVTAAGDIGPAEQVSVRPEVPGRISELPVDIGDVVKKGALLFALDDRDLQIERESKEQEIERARLQLSQAERRLERVRDLHARNLISNEEFEEARTEHDLARNDVDRAENALVYTNDKIRKTRVEAPFDCTVLTRPVSIGQTVSGSGGYNSGTEVLTIADLHRMIVNAHVNQADVTRLRPGQQVEVEVEAVQGLKVTGTVERIAPQATIRNNIKGFATRILLQGVDPQVRPGMTANVKIPVASADGVVAVPLAAVFTEPDPETGAVERYLFVAKDGRFERRTIRIGVSDYFHAEVQEGVAPGETVALEQPPEEKSIETPTPAPAPGGPTQPLATPGPKTAAAH